MSLILPELLDQEIRLRLARLPGLLGLSLGPLLHARLQELGLLPEQEGSYFLHPRALPVLQLPVWVAAGRLSEQRLWELCEASAIGYLAVRVQDDFIDESRGNPIEVLLLSGALLGRHLTLLGATGALPVLAQERWAGFFDAMLLERAHSRDPGAPCDESVFQSELRRAGPLLLPPAQALIETGGTSRIPLLQGFCDALASAHQRFQDLVDCAKDIENANFSPLIRALVQQGVAPERSALGRELLTGGVYDRVIAQANADLDRAASFAGQLGIPAALDFIEGRRALMRRTQESAFRCLFHALLAKSGAQS